VAFPALLDACVLYPVGTRDLLLSVAEREVFVPYWTKEILDEMSRNVVKDGRADARAMASMCEQMALAFPAALIEGYEPLIPVMTNHPKDRHVLAAAVRGHIGVIVTENRKDFSLAACDPYDIDIQTADEFLSYALDHDPPAVLGAIWAMAEKRSQPPMSPRELLAALSGRLPTFTEEATPIIDSIKQ
jgi:predicted nucleic acid-binding protein